MTVPRKDASQAKRMTMEIVVELECSCETVKGARVRQKHTMTTAERQPRNLTLLPCLFIKTHPDIEVDFLDDTAAVVQIQAELV